MVKIWYIAKIGRSIQMLSLAQVPDTFSFIQETQGVPSRVWIFQVTFLGVKRGMEPQSQGGQYHWPAVIPLNIFEIIQKIEIQKPSSSQ